MCILREGTCGLHRAIVKKGHTLEARGLSFAKPLRFTSLVIASGKKVIPCKPGLQNVSRFAVLWFTVSHANPKQTGVRCTRVYIAD